MCDTLCVLGAARHPVRQELRPSRERSCRWSRRTDAAPRGARLRTQYLELPDRGAVATVLSRPTWLWGAEHGVNEHGVAIGNEMVNTVDDPRAAPAALLGMDLVRLGLERAASAEDALDVMTTLLERHGQGGVGDAVNDVAYWSSFLIADHDSAWVLETSGRSWAARPVEGGGAISNRLTLRRDWTRASPGVTPGTDLDTWRDPATPTGFADGRLAASRAFVARSLASPASGVPSAPARAAVAHLRDHGTGPWGAPGSDGPVVAAPTEVHADGTGVTVCMHIRDFEATTASMVVRTSGRAGEARARLGGSRQPVRVGVRPRARSLRVGAARAGPRRAGRRRRRPGVSPLWAAPPRTTGRVSGTCAPCGARSRRRCGTKPTPSTTIPLRWQAFAADADRRVLDALDTLARAGIGPTA